MTSTRHPARRRILATAAAWGAVMAAGSAGAQPGPTGFSSLGVDVGPLRARGLGPYADAVGAEMQRELATAFADRISRGGPRLVARIDALSLRSYVGSESRFSGGGSQNDYLEGDALILGPRGQVLGRHHQLSALPSSSGGAWYLPDNESRRLAALCAHFAGWLRRDI